MLQTREDDTHSQDPAFKRFLGNLTKLGYFQGELPGSQKYMELLRQAQMQFTDMRTSVLLFGLLTTFYHADKMLDYPGMPTNFQHSQNKLSLHSSRFSRSLPTCRRLWKKIQMTG